MNKQVEKTTCLLLILIMRINIYTFLFCIFLTGCNRYLYKKYLIEIKDDSKANIVAKSEEDAAGTINKAETTAYYYKTLLGLDDNSTLASVENPGSIYIHRPTVIYKTGSGAEMIANPADSIVVTYDWLGNICFWEKDEKRITHLNNFKNWQFLLDSLGNSTRYTELYHSVNSAKEEMVKRSAFINSVSNANHKADSILVYLADSLKLTADEFNQLKQSGQNHFISGQLNYFSLMKEYSKIASIYDLSYTTIIKYYNSLKKLSNLSYHYLTLWELLRQLITYKAGIPSVYNKESFDIYLKEVSKVFKGPVYNYLAARVIYTGYKNKIITNSQLKHYARKKLKSRHYKALVKAIAQSYKDADYFISTSPQNETINAAVKKAAPIEQILDQWKGKLILVDFWASWCIPCRKENAPMRDLKRHYIGKDIVFITLSIDNSLLSWQKASVADQLDPEKNFLLNSNDSVFIFKNKQITEIPRYFLLDKSGNVITDNAPTPSDAALRELIDKHL